MKAKYIERFWSRVNKTATCWLWLAARQSQGYGVLRINCVRGSQGVLVYAHRVSYELTKGKIPDGLELDHLCRVRHCVNPDHLEAVSGDENIRRGISLAAINARKTHCKLGHPLSGDNLYLRPDGMGRQCLVCKSATFKGWYEKSKKLRAA